MQSVCICLTERAESAFSLKLLGVMLSRRQDAARIHLYALFDILGVPREKLDEVFEHKGIFTGRFVRNGRQKLADILNREIEYHKGYLGDPYGKVYFENKEGGIYKPHNR